MKGAQADLKRKAFDTLLNGPGLKTSFQEQSEEAPPRGPEHLQGGWMGPFSGKAGIPLGWLAIRLKTAKISDTRGHF